MVKYNRIGPVAQLARAPALHAGGCEFKSHPVHIVTLSFLCFNLVNESYLPYDWDCVSGELYFAMS